MLNCSNNVLKCLYIRLILLLYCCSGINVKNEKSTTEFTDSNQISVSNNGVGSQKGNQNTYLDSIKKELLILRKKTWDTLKYKFYLENIGTEGNEGVAYYLNDSLIKVQIEVYTSMWRYCINYTINPKMIEVIETTYNISRVNSDKDELINNIKYTIDFNGKLLGKTDKERIDIFQQFKEVVPFELN